MALGRMGYNWDLLNRGSSMAHDWEMDTLRSRLSISVLVWRCRSCGCLQIRKGGLDKPSVYRLNEPSGNPFRTQEQEPLCQPQLRDDGMNVMAAVRA